MVCFVHLPVWVAIKATLEILLSLCNILCFSFLRGRLFLPVLYSWTHVHSKWIGRLKYSILTAIASFHVTVPSLLDSLEASWWVPFIMHKYEHAIFLLRVLQCFFNFHVDVFEKILACKSLSLPNNFPSQALFLAIPFLAPYSSHTYPPTILFSFWAYVHVLVILDISSFFAYLIFIPHSNY